MKDPEVLLQVNRACPPGQTDTTPNGDRVMDVPAIKIILLEHRNLIWKSVLCKT